MTNPSRLSHNPKFRFIGTVSFLVLAVLGVYWQVGKFDFVNFDDPLYVTNNPIVQKGLTLKNILWAFTDATFISNYWAPLTWLSFLIDYEFYGLHGGGYHLTNVYLHIANTVLLFFLLNRMTLRFWQSAFIAALFALHPLHVESVAWITERKDVLSTFFLFLTLYGYSWYVERPGLRRYFSVFVLFLLGLMAKPMLVTLPFLLLLLDFWPLGRFNSGSQELTKRPFFARHPFPLLWEKLPFLLLALIVSAAAYMTQDKAGTVLPLNEYPISVRAANGLVTYVAYLYKMVWPTGLAPYYPHPGALPIWQSAGAFVILLAFTLLFLRKASRYPYLIVGWFWYLGILVPVIGLVVIGDYVMADRYTYVSLIGIFIIAALGISDLLQDWKHQAPVLTVLALLTISACIVTSWSQVRIWQNSITLFQHTLKINANNPLAHNNLCSALIVSGDYSDESLAHCYEALRLKPDSFNTYITLGDGLIRSGRTADALDNYVAILNNFPYDEHIYQYLLSLFAVQKRRLSGADDSRRSPEEKSRFKAAHENLGVYFAARKQHDRAVLHFEEALSMDFQDERIQNSLGWELLQKGDLIRAIVHFQEALNINPEYLEAQENLARVQTAIKQKNSRTTGEN